MTEDSLKNKTVKGTICSGIDNLSQLGVSFIVSIVLARLLSPDEYGLIGIITIFINVCNAIINGGFSSALIRKKEVLDEDYNTVFIINLGVSVLLYVLIYYLAPFIASFFGREELVWLLRISSIGVIIGALSLVQQTRLTKKIDFKTQTKITLISSSFSGFIGISLALLGVGVWALVAQSLSNQFIRTVLLWRFNYWMPSISFSNRSFRELFGFGWKIMLSGLLDTIWKELYQVVVGKFYSSATLGQYTRAKQFAQLFSINLTNVIQRVTYPVLANIQEDKARMVGAYRRIIKITMLVASVSMFSLGAVSEPLLFCLIGPKWNEAAGYLPLICVSMSLYPLHAINLNMIQVQGRSDLFLYLEIIKKIIGLIPLVICYYYGIIPMLYVNIMSGAICFYLNSYFSGKILGYSTWMQVKDIAPSYGLAILIALSVFFFKYLPVSDWFILLIQITVGIIVFVLFGECTKMEEYDEVKSIIKQVYFKTRTKI